jgi:hypothetical protein
VEKATINYLHDPDENAPLQRAQLDLLGELNRGHLAHAGHDPALEARIESFELAFRMQTEAPEIMDLAGESAATKKLYGLDQSGTSSFARQCLLARRFSERGVRFVQVTHGYWDQHDDLTKEHGRLGAEVDRPIAGLLRDLKSRGLLDETLVLWGGEFGRTPTLQGTDGRDHHPHAFTMWMAGGGVRAGSSYGITDEYGFYCVDQKAHVHDLHATILALLGINHEALTYRYAGRDVRLTDDDGYPLSWVVGGEAVRLQITMEAIRPVHAPIVGFFLKDHLGQTLFGDNTYLAYQDSDMHFDVHDLYQAEFSFEMPILPAGMYSVVASAAAGTQEHHVQHHWIHDALFIKSESSSHSTGLVGIPMSTISLMKLDNTES